MSEMNDPTYPISVRLDGKNLKYWCHMMTHFLRGRKLFGYVSGNVKAPIEGDDKVKFEKLKWGYE